MLITCPDCQTSYNIPDDLKGTGQKVRCAKCGCEWVFDEPEQETEELPDFSPDDDIPPLSAMDEEPETPKEPDMPFSAFQDLKQPEPPKNDKFKWIRPLYLATIAFTVIGILLLFFVPANKAPVILRTVSDSIIQEEYEPFLLLKTIAVNTSDRDITALAFEVRFSDEDGHYLTSISVFEPDVPLFIAKEMTSFDLKIERPPSQAAKAELELTKFRKN